MIPQKASRIPQVIATIAVVVYAVKNPEKAAHLVNEVIHAVMTFAGALG